MRRRALLGFLLACLQCVPVLSDPYIFGCSLKVFPREALALDKETGKFVLVEGDPENTEDDGDSGNRTRYLRSRRDYSDTASQA